MQSRAMNVSGRSKVSLMDRRLFLTRLAVISGAAVSASGLDLVTAAEPPRNAGQVTGDTSPAAGRGKVQQVRGEIKEHKDPKTGARVRRLTGDGSGNVHPYFTSWAFVGSSADNVIFASNRSGVYQWHLLDIPSDRASPASTSISRSRATWAFNTRWIARAGVRNTPPSSGPTGRGFASTCSPAVVRVTSSRTRTTALWSVMGPTFRPRTRRAASTSA